MSLREKIQESKDIVKQTMNQVKEMAKEIISAAAKAFRKQIVDNVLDEERKKEYIAWIIEQINKYDTIRLNRYLTKQKPPYFIDVDTTSKIKYKSFGEKLKKKVTEKVTGTIKKTREMFGRDGSTFDTSGLNEYMKEIHNRVIKVIDNLLKKEYIQYSIETAFLKTMNRMPFRYETKQYQFDEMLKDEFIDRKTNTIKKSFQVSLLNNRCGKNKTAKKPQKLKGGTLAKSAVKTMIKPITFIVRKELEKWLKRAMNHGLCEVIESMMNHSDVVRALEGKTKSFISNISLNVSLDRALVLFNPKFNTTVKKKGGKRKNKTAKKRMSYRGGLKMPKMPKMPNVPNYREKADKLKSTLTHMKNSTPESMSSFIDIKNPENIISSITKGKNVNPLENLEQYQEHIGKMTEFVESLQPRIQKKSESFSEILASDSLVKVFHTGLDRYYIEKVFDKHILRKTFLEYLRKTGQQIIYNNPRLKPTVEKILNGTHKTDCDVNQIRLTKDPNPLTPEEQYQILQLQNKASLVNPLAPLTAAFSSVIGSLRRKPKDTINQPIRTPQSKEQIQKYQEQIDQEIGNSFYDQNIRDKYEKHVNHAARRSKGESIYR